MLSGDQGTGEGCRATGCPSWLSRYSSSSKECRSGCYLYPGNSVTALQRGFATPDRWTVCIRPPRQNSTSVEERYGRIAPKRVSVHKVSTSRYICRRCGTRNINDCARHACCFVHPRQLRHKFNSNRLDSRTMGRLAPRDSPGVHTRLPRDHGTPAMERRPPNMATVRPTVAVFL